jgi:hypothetical protein
MNTSRQTAVIKRTSINTLYNNKQEEMLTSHSLLSHLEIRFYAKGCSL